MCRLPRRSRRSYASAAVDRYKRGDGGECEGTLLPLSDGSARARAARMVPWYGGAAFLLLTWLLLTIEIDGSSLQAHEFYGAPLIGLLAVGLTLYAWGRSITPERGSRIVGVVLLASIALAIAADQIALPGNPERLFPHGLTRGAITPNLPT